MFKLVALLVGVFAAVAAVDVDYRVPVKIIFRAFCPACKWYISDPVFTLLQNDEFRAISNIQYVPAAAMTETPSGGVSCLGGEDECEGHLWMACILDRFKSSAKATSAHMACFESNESGYTWKDKVAHCFSDAVDAAALTECKANQGMALLRELMVVAKANEGPWQPYTIVEDLVLGSATAAVSLDMLQDEICRWYTGPAEGLPEYCKNVVGVVQRTPPPLLATEPVVDKVKIQVIWRAYCPACKWFLSDPLYEVLSDAAFQAIVDFEPYPSGSTKEVSPGVFTCTGGHSECTGHLYMSCALRLFPQLRDVAANLKCMEDSHRTWDRRMAACFSGPALDQIKACFASNESKQYLHDYLAVTSSMDVPWVPYTKVNGKVLGTATTGVGYDLLTKAICDAYQSEVNRPSVCAPLVKAPVVAVAATEPAVAVAAVARTTTVAVPIVAAATTQKAAKDKKAVMPCRQKEKGFVYEDPPGIGIPMSGATPGAALAAGGVGVAPIKLSSSTPSSFITNPLLLPVLLIGGLLFAALRYSKPDKKDM